MYHILPSSPYIIKYGDRTPLSIVDNFVTSLSKIQKQETANRGSFTMFLTNVVDSPILKGYEFNSCVIFYDFYGFHFRFKCSGVL